MNGTQEEKELILGNKQLLSLFFVVVALCGVCFAMGYIIGHNTAKSALPPDTAQAQPPAGARQEPEPQPQRETASQPAEAAAVPSTAGSSAGTALSDPSAASAPVSTSPAADQPSTQPGRDVPDLERTPDAAPARTPGAQAGGGSYLQVSALSKPDADNLARTLREERFPVVMVESPKKGLYRVLVGPYTQTADLAEAKSRLKTLGFDNAFVQK